MRGIAVLAPIGLVALTGLGMLLSRAVAPPAAVPAAAAPPSAAFHLAADDPQLGRRAFVHCQGCHQPDGAGIAGNFPPLRGSGWLQGDPQAAILIVLHGFDARGEPGRARWNGVMPGYGGQLADHEVAGLLTWARSQWGNAGSAILPAQVAALRARFAERQRAWSPAELVALQLADIPR